MIERIEELLRNNRLFVEAQLRADPAYFERLAEGQHPEFLWIGCSDSRVPPDRITGTGPGDMFVHRNIANLVVQTDMNLLSVLQYAVEVLRVRHVIVCGHYGCGGVKAAMGCASHGLIDNWLRTIKDTQQYFRRQLEPLAQEARFRRLVELNVIEQVYNLGKTSVVQQAWREGRGPAIHGWVFELESGRIAALTGRIEDDEAMASVCKLHGAGALP
ncbi:carbonate dehydratase [Variovorax sp. MHTC-1]|uniref:carbonate dehydratase n=1 Tax=Variovorax sp. MHTC-1 TaxID=2495593 RepID=UPI000F871AE2|nr:carbonate dehydratase [Variovorax sp. MHTC-1]RST50100.1 carbonate dehydratase [Variovorax sp. MHTC-1]